MRKDAGDAMDGGHGLGTEPLGLGKQGFGARFALAGYADRQAHQKAQVEAGKRIASGANGGVVRVFKPVGFAGPVVQKHDLRRPASDAHLDDVVLSAHQIAPASIRAAGVFCSTAAPAIAAVSAIRPLTVASR